jgi:hypothetical protein
MQDLIQSEFFVEPRKKVGNPGLDVLLQYFFRMNILFPNERGVTSHGMGGNIVPPPDRNASPGGEHQNDSTFPNHNFQTVFDPLPVKANAQNAFLRRKKIQHFQDVVAGCAVDFSNESSNAVRQFASLDLSPVVVPGEICFTFTDQIESFEQRINPILVPSSLAHLGMASLVRFFRKFLANEYLTALG